MVASCATDALSFAAAFATTRLLFLPPGTDTSANAADAVIIAGAIPQPSDSQVASDISLVYIVRSLRFDTMAPTG